MTRAFIAVLLGEQAKKAVAAQINRLRPLTKAVTWVPPANLHVTLRFLGDQTETQLVDVMEALREAAVGVSAFTMRLRGLGAFPGLEHPRTIWVGVGDGSAEMKHLQSRVAEALARHGTPPEPGPWQAHVTIGRMPAQRRWRREGVAEMRSGLIRGAATTFGKTSVTSLELMRSDLAAAGARYTGIASVPLSPE
ncbi:MAG TPA: RNA 2',3'-cyclic phosphodiesterase [Candidatus Bathyarchaeia archaeon]|nr:RNA 2',3'-cyclic phosphodiesterase [Candidatus Bathyarchaeia archaeon]